MRTTPQPAPLPTAGAGAQRQRPGAAPANADVKADTFVKVHGNNKAGAGDVLGAAHDGAKNLHLFGTLDL